MYLLDLPEDVFFAILSACTKSSLNAMCLTSSHCKNAAKIHLLRTVQLDRDATQIYSFLDYIISNTRLSDDGTKELLGPGVFVKIFQIRNFREPDSSTSTRNWAAHLGPYLKRALFRMPNVRIVAIEHSLNVIAAYYSKVAIALLSRPHLHTLHLGGLQRPTSNLLGGVMTHLEGEIPLQKLVLNAADQDMKLTPDEGIGHILFHHRQSLTEIGIGNCDLKGLLYKGAQMGGDASSDKGLVVFPRVATISLSRCIVSSYALAYSFPNVRTVTMAHCSLPEGNTSPTSSAISGTPLQLFPNLSSLTGPDSIVMAILQHHGPYDSLRRIMIKDVWTSVDCIYKTAPYLESLRFPLIHAGTDAWWTQFACNLLRLKFLSFHTGVKNTENVDTLFVKLPRLLSSMPLEYLAISLSNRTYQYWGKKDAKISLCNTDEEIALTYARNIQTLQYFELCRIRYGGRKRWWRVVRDKREGSQQEESGSPGIREIDEEDGENARNFFDWNW